MADLLVQPVAELGAERRLASSLERLEREERSDEERVRARARSLFAVSIPIRGATRPPCTRSSPTADTPTMKA